MTKTKAYIDFILTELRKGNVEPKSIITQFCTKFHKTDRTFWNMWNIASEEYKTELEAIKKEKAELYQAETLEAFKTQIKSKIERLAIYQTQIDHIEKELETGKTKELLGYKDGKAQVIERDLTVFEKNSLRKTLKELQAEISKIEGDYAPKQIEMVEGINIIIE